MTCTDTDARTSARTGEDAGGALITRRSVAGSNPAPATMCAGQTAMAWGHPGAWGSPGGESPCQRPSDREGLAACHPFVTRSR
jgi:hypothetical protein